MRKGMVMKQPFEKVVEQHGGTVLRVCRVVLGVHDAEDAWSETFLAAMRAYPDLPDDANAEAWLVTIAHRKAIDVIRARKRRPAPVERAERHSRLRIARHGDDAIRVDGAVNARRAALCQLRDIGNAQTTDGRCCEGAHRNRRVLQAFFAALRSDCNLLER